MIDSLANIDGIAQGSHRGLIGRSTSSIAATISSKVIVAEARMPSPPALAVARRETPQPPTPYRSARSGIERRRVRLHGSARIDVVGQADHGGRNRGMRALREPARNNRPVDRFGLPAEASEEEVGHDSSSDRVQPRRWLRLQLAPRTAVVPSPLLMLRTSRGGQRR